MVLIFFARLLPVFTTHYVGQGGDALQSMWFLAWPPFAIAHGLNPFFSQWMRAEAGVNLLWNASNELLGIVFWPVLALAGPVAEFNTAILVSVFLSAWSAYYAALRLLKSRGAAFVVGLLYAFSPYMIAHLAGGHLNLVAVFVPPLLLVVLYEAVHKQERSCWRIGVFLGILLAAQFFISQELLATEVLMSVVGVALYCAARWRSLNRSWWRYFWTVILVGVCLDVILLAYPLAMQFFGPWRVHGAVQPPGVYVADMLNFFVPGPVQRLTTHGANLLTRHFTGNLAEADDYMGIPLLLLLVGTAAYLWRWGLGRWALAMICVTGLLTMGGHLHVGGVVGHVPLPWHLVSHLSLFGDILPARMGVYLYLFCGLAVALWLVHSPNRRQSAWRYAAVGLVLLSLLPATPFVTPAPAIPPVLSQAVGRGTATKTLLFVPVPDTFHVDPFLWQAKSGFRFKMLGGYGYPGSDDPYVVKLAGPIYRIEHGMPTPETPQLMAGARAVARKASCFVLLPHVHHVATVGRFLSRLGLHKCA